MRPGLPSTKHAHIFDDLIGGSQNAMEGMVIKVSSESLHKSSLRPPSNYSGIHKQVLIPAAHSTQVACLT